ncbi:MAG: hypothetical protein B7Y81_04285 [Caulobacter sp. 32-67-35]|nr:MAG: hypothetical protein B7Y81_04285 [Caulobacter sp. 32-67-35]
MFGGKKAPVVAEQDSRDGQYTHRFEYKTLAILGAAQFDKTLNEHAAKGWDLVSGCMAGTVHYGYLRRPLNPA